MVSAVSFRGGLQNARCFPGYSVLPWRITIQSQELRYTCISSLAVLLAWFLFWCGPGLLCTNGYLCYMSYMHHLHPASNTIIFQTAKETLAVSTHQPECLNPSAVVTKEGFQFVLHSGVLAFDCILTARTQKRSDEGEPLQEVCFVITAWEPSKQCSETAVEKIALGREGKRKEWYELVLLGLRGQGRGTGPFWSKNLREKCWWIIWKKSRSLNALCWQRLKEVLDMRLLWWAWLVLCLEHRLCPAVFQHLGFVKGWDRKSEQTAFPEDRAMWGLQFEHSVSEIKAAWFIKKKNQKNPPLNTN